MEEEALRSMASQLSCPQGESGIEVGNKMNELNQFITQQTIDKLAVKTSESIVEIGPGNGALSLPLVDALGNDGFYLGIEKSEVMAAESSQALSQRQCNVNVFCGDYLDVNINKESVDGIMAVNVLYFIEDLAQFFKQIMNWIKPSGRVVFGVRSDKALKSLPFTQYGFNIRSANEIERLMKESGFKSVESFFYQEGSVPFGDIMIPVDSVIIVGKKAVI